MREFYDYAENFPNLLCLANWIYILRVKFECQTNAGEGKERLTVEECFFQFGDFPKTGYLWFSFDYTTVSALHCSALCIVSIKWENLHN